MPAVATIRAVEFSKYGSVATVTFARHDCVRRNVAPDIANSQTTPATSSSYEQRPLRPFRRRMRFRIRRAKGEAFGRTQTADATFAGQCSPDNRPSREASERSSRAVSLSWRSGGAIDRVVSSWRCLRVRHVLQFAGRCRRTPIRSALACKCVKRESILRPSIRH
jgi:hypothetical protein